METPSTISNINSDDDILSSRDAGEAGIIKPNIEDRKFCESNKVKKKKKIKEDRDTNDSAKITKLEAKNQILKDKI